MANENNNQKIEETNPYQLQKANLEAHKYNFGKYSKFVEDDLLKLSWGYDHGLGRHNGPIAATAEESYNKSMDLINKGKVVPRLQCYNAHQTVAGLINDAGGQALQISAFSLSPKMAARHSFLGFTSKANSHEYIGSSWGEINTNPFPATNVLDVVQEGKARMLHQISDGTDVVYSREKENGSAFKQLAVGDMLPMKSNFDPNSSNVLNAPFKLSSNREKYKKTLTLKPQADILFKKGNDPHYGKFITGTAQGELYGNINLGKGYNLQTQAIGNISRIETQQTKALFKGDNTTGGSIKGANYNLLSSHVETMFTPPSLRLGKNISATPFLDINYDAYKINTEGKITELDTGKKYSAKFSGSSNNNIGLVAGVDYKAGTDMFNVNAAAYGGVRFAEGFDGTVNENRKKVKIFNPEAIYGAKVGVSSEIKDDGVKSRISGEAAQVNVDSPGRYDLTNRYLKASLETVFGDNKIFTYEGVNNRTIDFDKYVGRYNENRVFLGGGYQRQIGDVTLSAAGEKYGSGYSVGLTAAGVLSY